MTRLIDADAAIGGVKNRCIGQSNVVKVEHSIISMLYMMPTVDAVPVVRCKDCKWYYRGGATCMYWDGENNMHGDDYCSRAERKEE